MGTPTRFTHGVTTAAREATLGMFGMPDPTLWHVFFDDFNGFVTDTTPAGKYTITTVEAGGSSATEAIGDAAGGVLVITNDAADNDSDFFQKIGESFLIAAGKKALFKIRFKVSDATLSDWIAGLVITDTTPLAAAGDGATDGIFFQKDSADTDIDFYVQKNATTGQLTNTAVASAAADDTYMTLGFYYNGKRSVELFKNDVMFKTVDLTTAPSTYLPDTELTVTFGIQNGEAVAKVMTIDYVFAAIER